MLLHTKYFYIFMITKQGLLQEMQGKSGSFALVFLLLFGVTFGFLTLVGATPDDPGTSATIATNTKNPVVTTPVTPSAYPVAPVPANSTTPQPEPVSQPYSGNAELPTRIVVKKIGLNVVVANPPSTNVDVLDNYLLKGAVRYPTSGRLGENGTVLLFGHSSYLPIVHNQAFKAFDGIQDLKAGDIVSVFSGSTEYRFSVTGVKVADATQDTVPLPQDAQHLTLVTCDSFASKSNRFVVTADLVATNPV